MLEKLDRIRSQENSKLPNQKQVCINIFIINLTLTLSFKLAIILSAVEENLDEEKTDHSPTAYFVSFLGLLEQGNLPAIKI